MLKNDDSMVRKKSNDAFLDISGQITQVPYSKKMIVAIVVAGIILLLGSKLPFDMFGNNTGLALSFFVATILILIISPWSVVITAMLIPLIGIWLGFWTWPDVQIKIGTSAFVQLFAMMIVGAGAETTPIGKRIALVFLKAFGQKPIRMLIAIFTITATLSAMISNNAVLIMMSGIMNGLLLTMVEVPGKSKYGRIVMTLIPAASYIGGAALINGAPAGNAFGISLMNAASGGAYTITYAQWAIMGGVAISNEYIDDSLKELGPIGGSEIRWLLYMIAMILLLVFGGNSTTVPLFFAVISLLPVVGTVPVNDVFNRIPMFLVFTIMFMPTLGLLLSNTGLGNMLALVLEPVLSGLSPYMFSVVACFIAAVTSNVFVNGQMLTYTVIITIATQLCVSMGYNPTVVMLPTIMMAAFFFWIRLDAEMLLNKHYGWWETKDNLLAGFISIIFMALAIPAICFLMAPVANLAIYL